MSGKGITEKAKEYVKSTMDQHNVELLTFHSFEHTSSVVESALEIGQNSGLNEEELEILEVAAWFHDLGYLEGFKDHETKSWAMANAFLETENYPEAKAQLVKDCIMATSLHVTPKTMLEKVIADADLNHLAKPSQASKSEALRLEIKRVCGYDFSTEEWLDKDLGFLLAHHYHTPYAQEHYHPGKVENIERAFAKKGERIAKKQAKKDKKKLDKALKVQQEKVNSSKERSAQTLFRVTLRNHINLSAIADNKANIMLSVNAIIITIMVSTITPNYEHLFVYSVPLIIMILTNAVSIMLAIKSTRPKVSKNNVKITGATNRSMNLLFFGNFQHLELEDFEEQFNALLEDKGEIYNALIKDLYYLGKVLAEKYRYLRLTYTVFSIGFLATIVSFLIILFIGR